MRWTLTSVTAAPARMVQHAKILLTSIGVTALHQSWVRNLGVGETVRSAWWAAGSISVNTMQVVSLC